MHYRAPPRIRAHGWPGEALYYVNFIESDFFSTMSSPGLTRNKQGGVNVPWKGFGGATGSWEVAKGLVGLAIQ